MSAGLRGFVPLMLAAALSACARAVFPADAGDANLGAEDTPAVAADDSADTVRDPLGTRWLETENGCWSGTWTRISGTNQFADSQYESCMHVSLTSTMTITITGNHVHAERSNASDGNNCTFEGTLMGNIVSGTYNCPLNGGPYTWRATIE